MHNEDLIAIHKFAWNNPDIISRELFGFKMHRKQTEMLQSITLHQRIAVRSGHKCCKTFTAAFAALFWCLFAPTGKGRVAIFSNTHKQLNNVLYQEIKQFLRLLKQKNIDIGVHSLSADAGHGITFTNDSFIRGYSLEACENNPDALSGLSGEILYIVDEASGIDTQTFETLTANPLSTILLISNPLRKSGPFFKVFSDPEWFKIHMSSEDVAQENIIIGTNPINDKPIYLYTGGAATIPYIEKMKSQHQINSYFYQVRIAGNFCNLTENSFIPAEDMDASIIRTPIINPEDPISIGIDIAWSTNQGKDHTSICVRQGGKVHSLEKFKASSPEIRAKVKALLTSTPTNILVDTTNNPAFFQELSSDLQDAPNISLYGISFQSRITSGYTEPKSMLVPQNIRAELYCRLKNWVSTVGNIPNIPELIEEISAIEPVQRGNKLDITPKDTLRKLLSRSPDLADALALSCYGC